MARVSFEIARRHRFNRELSELPDGVEAHVLPARGTSSRDDSLLGHRDFAGVQDRIDATYEAQRRLPRRAGLCQRTRDLGAAAAGDRAARRPVTVLLWITLPLWLIAAAALSPLLPGRLAALRLMWVAILYLTCEALLLVVLFGLWLASGFGWRMRTPYFEGIHYDLVQGAMWVFFREARRVLALRIETDGPAPDAHPGRADPGLLPARRPRRLVHADPRADGLVRPRAAGGAQGHPGVGPGDRRAAAPDPGAVHHPEPGRGRGSRSRSPPSPPASTRTTPS